MIVKTGQISTLKRGPSVFGALERLTRPRWLAIYSRHPPPALAGLRPSGGGADATFRSNADLRGLGPCSPASAPASTLGALARKWRCTSAILSLAAGEGKQSCEQISDASRPHRQVICLQNPQVGTRLSEWQSGITLSKPSGGCTPRELI